MQSSGEAEKHKAFDAYCPEIVFVPEARRTCSVLPACIADIRMSLS